MPPSALASCMNLTDQRQHIDLKMISATWRSFGGVDICTRGWILSASGNIRVPQAAQRKHLLALRIQRAGMKNAIEMETQQV